MQTPGGRSRKRSTACPGSRTDPLPGRRFGRLWPLFLISPHEACLQRPSRPFTCPGRLLVVTGSKLPVHAKAADGPGRRRLARRGASNRLTRMPALCWRRAPRCKLAPKDNTRSDLNPAAVTRPTDRALRREGAERKAQPLPGKVTPGERRKNRMKPGQPSPLLGLTERPRDHRPLQPVSSLLRSSGRECGRVAGFPRLEIRVWSTQAEQRRTPLGGVGSCSAKQHKHVR